MNCLNCARDLPRALASVRAQTWQGFEIIFWDNASTDESGAIAQAYGPALRYFRGEKTISLGAARNLAIAKAKGDYIAFLDCDDEWRPEKLAEQLKLFQQDPETGLVCTDTEIVDGKRVAGRVFAKSRPARGYAYKELLERQWITMSSAMARREALNGEAEEPGKWFDEHLELCEEADLFYRIAHSWKLDYVDGPLTIWRAHGGNTTFRKFALFADETSMILAKQRRMYPEFDEKYPELGGILERRAAFQKAIAMWAAGDGQNARRHLAPYVRDGSKYRMFWLASFLPGSFFNAASRLYFALPGFLRR